MLSQVRHEPTERAKRQRLGSSVMLSEARHERSRNILPFGLRDQTARCFDCASLPLKGHPAHCAPLNMTKFLNSSFAARAQTL